MVPQNLMPDQRLQRLAQHALTAEHHEQRDAGDGMRHRERQVDQRGDHALAGKRRARQPIGERHPDQGGERRGQKGRFQAERDRLAHVGHARHVGEARPRLRERQRDQRDDEEGEQHAAEEPAQQIKAARTARRGSAPPPACCRASGMASTPMRAVAPIRTRAMARPFSSARQAYPRRAPHRPD